MKVKFAFAYCAKSDNLADKVASLNHKCLFPDENRPLTVQFSKGCITCYIFNYLINSINRYIFNLLPPSNKNTPHSYYSYYIDINIPTIPTYI